MQKMKVLIVTADFEPGTDTVETHYGRIINGVLEGVIKPSTNSAIECYCNICKKTFAGIWIDHQRTVHKRIFPTERRSESSTS